MAVFQRKGRTTLATGMGAMGEVLPCTVARVRAKANTDTRADTGPNYSTGCEHQWLVCSARPDWLLHPSSTLCRSLSVHPSALSQPHNPRPVSKKNVGPMGLPTRTPCRSLHSWHMRFRVSHMRYNQWNLPMYIGGAALASLNPIEMASRAHIRCGVVRWASFANEPLLPCVVEPLLHSL